jgi:hypothetical protein
VRFLVVHPPSTAAHYTLRLQQQTTEVVQAAGATAAAELHLKFLNISISGAIPTASAGEEWTLPHPLPAGNYSLVLALQGAAGGAAQHEVVFRTTGAFARTIRPWEGLQLGRADIVIQPYTPITVSQSGGGGNAAPSCKLGVIGREYTVGGAGLWDSVDVTPPATPRMNCSCTAADVVLKTPGCAVVGDVRAGCVPVIALMAAPMALIVHSRDGSGAIVEHRTDNNNGNPERTCLWAKPSAGFARFDNSCLGPPCNESWRNSSKADCKCTWNPTHDGHINGCPNGCAPGSSGCPCTAYGYCARTDHGGCLDSAQKACANNSACIGFGIAVGCNSSFFPTPPPERLLWQTYSNSNSSNRSADILVNNPYWTSFVKTGHPSPMPPPPPPPPPPPNTTVIEEGPTRVATETTWTAGPLIGATRVEYDYDGCAKVSIKLSATKTPIISLQLVIPLRLKEAYLMHTVTDFMRIHYAGSIPAGEGEVYNTTKINRYMLPGPFVPYVFVGGAERGIAFFSDNDQDWRAAEPAFQIYRDTKNETVTLVVNLLSANRPSGAHAGGEHAREIVFGLMASPAKPQPSSPVPARDHWPPWLRIDGLGGAPRQVSTNLIANSMYWGTVDNCAGWYPYLENYSIWTYFAERRAGATTSDFINTEWLPWLAQRCVKNGNHSASPDCFLGNTSRAQSASVNLECGANRMTPDRDSFIVPYTNPQGLIWDEDTQNFQDEWTDYDIADPRWTANTFTHCWTGPDNVTHFPLGCPSAGYGTIKTRFGYQMWIPYNWNRELNAGLDRELASDWVNGRGNGSVLYYRAPVRSMADMGLWYSKKMMASFADGIYYDNHFLMASYQPASALGPGYVDVDTGLLKPGVSIWAWREFAKRSAVLQAELGKRHTALMIHMTSVNLLPVMGWASVNYDWEELEDGAIRNSDFQTRFKLGCDATGRHCTDTNNHGAGAVCGVAIGHHPICRR